MSARFEGVKDAPVVASLYSSRAACPTAQVRVDPAGDYAFVFVPFLAEGGPPKYWLEMVAFRTSSVQAISFTSSVAADRIAPPLGWRISALFGIAIALALLLAARRIRGRNPTHAVDAHHRGDGFCELEPDLMIRVPVAATLPVGPVVLVPAESRLASYRVPDGPAFHEARAGTTLAEMDRAARYTSIALAAATLGTTPLLVALFFGV